jgi:hypothetical protein
LAGVEAPAEQPDEVIQVSIAAEDFPLVFAGTGLNPDAVFSALGSALAAGPVNAAFMSFWLGYELGAGS